MSARYGDSMTTSSVPPAQSGQRSRSSAALGGRCVTWTAMASFEIELAKASAWRAGSSRRAIGTTTMGSGATSSPGGAARASRASTAGSGRGWRA